MAIRIVRNDAGNCITFQGTDNPIYWNNCLSGEINATDANNVNIINDIRTAQTGVNKYEFFNIPYTDFEDKDGNQFTDAQSVVDYIDENANIVGASTIGANLNGTDVDFRLDQTSTTILVDNGLQFGVNSIKAVPHQDGTIHINAIGAGLPTGTEDVIDRVHLEQIEVGRVSIDGVTITGGLSDVANALNELFQVGAFESVVISDPFSTLIADISGTPTTTNYIGNSIDPIGSDVYAATASGNLNGYTTNETINSAGEYFTFDIRVEGVIGFGLVHTQASYDDGYFNGNSTYANPATFGTSNSAHYGYQFSHWFHPTPNGPWTNYGANTSYVAGPGWSNATYRFSNSPEGADWLAGNPVKMRVGIDANSFISIDYYDVSESSWVVCARTAYPIVEGAEFKLGIKTNDTNVRVASLPQIHELTPAAPAMYFRYIESPDNAFSYPLFATEVEANYYDLNNGGTGTNHSHVYVDDPTFGTWYMPDNGASMNIASAPTGTETFLDNTINWTEITTLVDAAFAPAAYPDTTITVNEGGAINAPVIPADATFTTTITDVNSSGVALVGTNVQGTAPQVVGDNVANPSDTYLVNITRTNSYGSSTGILTLVVNNLTAPSTAISGFTWDSGSTALVDSDTLDDGSVVTMDNQLDSPYRFIFPQSWVESYVLPALANADDGDKVYLGIKDGAGDLTNGVVDADWDAYISWERLSASSHKSTIYASTKDEMTISSISDSFYDYAFEADAQGNVYVIACNVNAINTEPGVNEGGSFSRIVSTTGTAPLTLSLVTQGLQMDFDDTGLSEIIIPASPNWVQVTESGNVLSFDGSTTFPTLQAGNTYRLLVGNTTWSNQTTLTGIKSTEIVKFTADGTTEYDMGGTWTQSGTVGIDYAYIEFTVPSDVPPLHWYGSAAHNPINTNSAYAVAISGSTYVVPITGITLEGPAANQTGTNVMDALEHGWISLDEQLSAGERLVLDNAFFEDFLDATKDTNNIFAIGLKGNNWANTTEINSNGAGAAVQNSETFRGNTYIVGLWGSSASGLTMWIFADGVGGNSLYMNSPSNYATTCAFLEITSDGNNIRVGMGRNNSTGNITQGDESTVTYAGWNAYKGETNNRTLGISSIDVVMSFWTLDGGAIDGNDIDWTLLSEINIPVPAPTNSTPWNKAIDFSGGSEHLSQESGTNSYYAPLAMAGASSIVTAPTTGQTVTSGHPWATAVVFQTPNNTTNQHIWNLGEGAGTNDDNIYLRMAGANGELYLGWGRVGVGFNEYHIGNFGGSYNQSTGQWWGIYVGFNGTRLSGANATAANLVNAFDIKLMGTNDVTPVFSNLYDVGSDVNNWTSTGVRMDRQFTGQFTVGGRGANRSFHGKVASTVVTTLRCGVAMPTDAEVKLMLTDPIKWLNDYKVGQNYRQSNSTADSTNWQIGNGASSASTQVWLMGDNTARDSYPKIWSYTNNNASTDGYNVRLDMNSQVSSDIETVTISGLS